MSIEFAFLKVVAFAFRSFTSPFTVFPAFDQLSNKCLSPPSLVWLNWCVYRVSIALQYAERNRIVASHGLDNWDAFAGSNAGSKAVVAREATRLPSHWRPSSTSDLVASKCVCCGGFDCGLTSQGTVQAAIKSIAYAGRWAA